MPDFRFFGMFFALLGVAEVAAGLPLMLRLVKPNPFFGLHLSATRVDETVWYDANAGTGRDLLGLGIAQLIAAGLPLVFDMHIGTYVVVNISQALVGACALAVIGGIRAHFLLKKRQK